MFSCIRSKWTVLYQHHINHEHLCISNAILCDNGPSPDNSNLTVGSIEYRYIIQANKTRHQTDPTHLIFILISQTVTLSLTRRAISDDISNNWLTRHASSLSPHKGPYYFQLSSLNYAIKYLTVEFRERRKN